MIDQGCKEVEMAISLYQEVRRYTPPHIVLLSVMISFWLKVLLQWKETNQTDASVLFWFIKADVQFYSV